VTRIPAAPGTPPGTRRSAVSIDASDAKVDDPLIILGIAEVILFLTSFGILFGTKLRRTGIVLVVLWAVVLVVCVTWGIIRKLS